METSRIGILGARGRLGTELLKLGCTGIQTDITSLSDLQQIKWDFNAVINCVAKSNVDWCENNIIPTYKINGFSIENIAKVFSEYFIQISTDYIFDGKNGPYGELDEPNPIQTYGFSKWVGEQITERLFSKHLIIRTTNLYDNGASGKSNFVLETINLLKNNKSVRVTDELFGNPTYTPELASAIISAINKNITGKLNLVGNTVCSRYELAQHVAKIFNYDIHNVVKGKFWSDAKRPEHNGLKLNRANELGIYMTDVQIGLLELQKVLDK